MASGHGKAKKKPYGKLLLMGGISLVLYAVLLSEQHLINSYFGRGGAYAFFPIATAFIFSFVHGSFTGNFWTSLGIEASRRKEVK
ncbi:MAG: hypothetical protein IT388_08620 [Nitrospirales bacterium]|nr:hypothetical protein [Nitrospirales bacterium]